MSEIITTKTFISGTHYCCKYCGKDLGEANQFVNTINTKTGNVYEMRCNCKLGKKEIKLREKLNKLEHQNDSLYLFKRNIQLFLLKIFV